MDPDQANVRNALALALKEQGRLDEAVAEFQACVGCGPRHHLAWSNFAGVLAKLERHADAIAAIDDAVALAPTHAQTLEAALHLWLDCAAWDGPDELVGKVSRANRTGGPINPFALFSCCVDPRELRLAARSHARHVERKARRIPR